MAAAPSGWDPTIDTEPFDSTVRISPSARRAEEWATVLAASGIPHRLALTDSGWALVVADGDSRRANAALTAYDQENRPAIQAPVSPIGRSSIALGIVVAGLLLGFFALTGPRRAGIAWFERGSASAAAILGGEVWRTITALTLHADLAHVLGNAVACLILIPPVGHALGPGTGLWVLLMSGAIGNALTAIVQGAPHNSVGASTLTFGAIGVLAGQALVARWHAPTTGRRSWVIVVASVVLLSMLGTAEGADILGHVFGLATGALLGLIVGFTRPSTFTAKVEWALAAAALVAVVACWWVSWR